MANDIILKQGTFVLFKLKKSKKMKTVLITVSGNLTLLGKTMNVSFPAKVDVVDKSANVAAKFTVNRADWGIKFGTSEADPAEWMISKDIEITIDVKAAQK